MKYVKAIRTMEEAVKVKNNSVCYWNSTSSREREFYNMNNKTTQGTKNDIYIIDDGGGSTLTQEMLNEDVLLVVFEE